MFVRSATDLPIVTVASITYPHRLILDIKFGFSVVDYVALLLSEFFKTKQNRLCGSRRQIPHGPRLSTRASFCVCPSRDSISTFRFG